MMINMSQFFMAAVMLATLMGRIKADDSVSASIISFLPVSLRSARAA